MLDRGRDAPIGRTLADPADLLLINGPKRFGDLRRDNPKISQRMLTLELRELEAAGVVSRKVYPTKPPQVEYELTPDGRNLIPLINALGDWWEQLDRHRRTATGQEAVPSQARQQPITSRLPNESEP